MQRLSSTLSHAAKGGRDTLGAILDGDSDTVRNIVAKNQWEQLNDEAEIRKACEDVIAEQPKLVCSLVCYASLCLS